MAACNKIDDRSGLERRLVEMADFHHRRNNKINESLCLEAATRIGELRRVCELVADYTPEARHALDCLRGS